jgi:hypothetical protein
MLCMQVKTIEQMMSEACVAADVNRHDLIRRGLQDDDDLQVPA